MSISFQKSIRSWILQRRNERTAFVAFFAICKRRKKTFFLSKTLVKYKNWYKKYQKFVVFCKNEKFMNKKKTLVVWLKATFVVFEFFRPQIRILEALLCSPHLTILINFIFQLLLLAAINMFASKLMNLTYPHLLRNIKHYII